MATRIRRTTVTGLLATACVLAIITAAHAAHTSITVGGVSSPTGAAAFTADNTSTLSFETNFGVETNCETVAIEGQILRGAPVTIGTTIGHITDISMTNCSWTSLGVPMVVHGASGDLVVRSHPAHAGDPVPVTIENLEWQHHSTGGRPYACEMFLDGEIDAVLTPAPTGNDAEFSFATVGQDVDITTGDGFGNRQTTPGSPSCANQIETGDLFGPLGGDFDLSTGGAGAISHG